MDFDSPAAAQKAVTALKSSGVQAQMAKVSNDLPFLHLSLCSVNPLPPRLLARPLPPTRLIPMLVFLANFLVALVLGSLCERLQSKQLLWAY